MEKLALTMIVKNEEKVIARCLESVKSIVDEIIIVDTGSEDKTKEIARLFGALVYDYEWGNNFADARNFALKKSTCDWNLVLDADEYISSFDVETVKVYLNNKNYVYSISIINSFLNDNNDVEHYKINSTRIIPKGVYFKGRIHEQVETTSKRVLLPIEVCHDGYLGKTKSQRNIPLLQMELLNNEKNPYLLYKLAEEYRGLKDYKSADIYFKRAYLNIDRKKEYSIDLLIDYIYNIMRLGKVEVGLKLIEEEKDYLNEFAGFHFACGLFYMDLILSDIEKYIAYFHKIESSFLSSLNIGESRQGVIGAGSFAALYNLGVYHEVVGDKIKAQNYYRRSAEYDYRPAIERLIRYNNM